MNEENKRTVNIMKTIECFSICVRRKTNSGKMFGMIIKKP